MHQKRNHFVTFLLFTSISTILVFFAILGVLIYFFGHNPLFWIIFLLIHTLTLIYLAMHMHLNNNYPEYRFFWLFCSILVPWFGFFGYLFSGQIYFLKKKQRLWKKISAEYVNFEDQSLKVKLLKHPQLTLDIQKIFRFSTQLSPHALYTNVRLNLLSEPFSKFFQFRIDLEAAQKYIYINYFIIVNGDCLDFIIDLLITKLKKGIKVYIIYDFIGTIFNSSLSFVWRLKKHGAKFRSFGSVLIGGGEINYRNHRKDLIIDGKIAYTGGYNIGDEYCHMSSVYGVWRDTHVRIEGIAAQSLELIFLKDWKMLNRRKIQIRSTTIPRPPPITSKTFIRNIVQVVDDGPQIKKTITRDLLVYLFNSAKKRIWIVTPFFFTDQAFLKTLLNAALSGVDVRMVLPSLSYKITIDLMRLPYAKMLDAGIKIYEYKGYLHSKVTIIDNDLMTVGTANLDYNSFYWANQTTLLIYDSHLVKQAEKEIFANDFRHSDLLKSDPLNKSSRFYLWFLKFISIIKLFI